MAKSRVSGTSIALLILQLLIVSSIAGKYLYQRWSNPRVWTRAAAYDPSLPMRGRYLSLQLVVDGCRSTLNSAMQAEFPRAVDGSTRPGGYSVKALQPVSFAATLKVEQNRLEAIRIQPTGHNDRGQKVLATPGASCEALRLEEPVDFFISEHAVDPTRLGSGQELWIEVTVPSKGPPRPLQLAIKDNGAWRPLNLQ